MLENLLLALGLLVVGSAAYAGIQGAPWVPTRKADIKRLARLIDLKPGESFVELGCGNARVCRHLKGVQPQAAVTGIELSLLPYSIGWIQNQLRRSQVAMKFGNVFACDLSKYDALYLFLMPEAYKKLRPKFEAELKAGARVVCYVWPIPDWEVTQVDELAGTPKLFFYQR